MHSSKGSQSLEPNANTDSDADCIDLETSKLLQHLDALLFAENNSGLNGIAFARAKASTIFSEFAGPSEGGEISTVDISVEGEQDDIPARIYRSKTLDDKIAPLVIFFHGGGWSLGALDDYEGLLRALAVLSGAIIISVDYRLAPEHPFPAGLNDAIAATSFISRNAGDFGGDPCRIAVMGDSAGGNLAAVIAQQSRNADRPAITAQFLLYPMLDVSRPHTDFRSRMRYGSGDHFLTRDGIDASVADYLTDPRQSNSPSVSPLNEPGLGGVPPAYIVVGGCDPLGDEAAAYFERLKLAGVNARLHCVPGAIHGFLSFGVLEVARLERRALAAEIKRSLMRTR
jgi:acetyl esterase/lipase